MSELKAETSTQKLFWDSENEIVWGELFGDQVTEELAKENVDAQERVRDGLNRTKTRVISSPVSRVIGNFFMGLNKPISPTRLFTDPHKAIQWLHTFSDD